MFILSKGTTTAANMTRAITIKTTSNTNTTIVTTITTMPKDRKVKFLGNFEKEGELYVPANPPVCGLSKRRINNVLGTVLCVIWKLAGIVVRDVELIDSQYLHPNVTASTQITTAPTVIATSTTAIHLRLLLLILLLLLLVLVLLLLLKKLTVLRQKFLGNIEIVWD